MKRLWSAALICVCVGAGFLAGAWVTWPASGRGQTQAARKVLHWVDPMHPFYRSDKPGIAPDCGMQLEPVYADDPSAATGMSMPPGTLRVPVEKQQVVGVRLGQVERSPATRRIRTVGRVAVNEDRIYRLVAATEGIVRELFPNSAGSLVRKDQVLLTFSSRDFLAAQQAYFYALNTRDRISTDSSEPTDQASLTRDQLRQAVDSL